MDYCEVRDLTKTQAKLHLQSDLRRDIIGIQGCYRWTVASLRTDYSVSLWKGRGRSNLFTFGLLLLPLARKNQRNDADKYVDESKNLKQSNIHARHPLPLELG